MEDEPMPTSLARRLLPFLAALLLVAGQAQATPVALATDVSGEMSPPVEPWSEIPAGTAVVLADDAEMVFLHYWTCESVTVRGGRLSFTSERYTLQGGRILDARRTPCPRAIVLSESGELGGMVLRGSAQSAAQVAQAYPVSDAPSFVLAGRKAGDFARIRVAQGEVAVLDEPIRDRSFHWPEGVPRLHGGETYAVTLEAADGATQHDFTILVARAARAGDITLVRLD
jgi:hypothetical protein